MGLIYLDSCLLIYAIEQDPVFGERVVMAIDSQTSTEFAVSPLVKLECLVKPLGAGNVALKQYYEAAFETLTTLPMPEEVYLSAALLRARFRLKTPDALHLSCAQFHRCASLWTNDHQFSEAGHGLAVNIFADDR